VWVLVVEIEGLVDSGFDLEKKMSRFLRFWPAIPLSLFALSHAHRFPYSIYRVQGSSMNPTFSHNDILLVSSTTCNKGDVVILKHPNEPERKVLLKRITGVAGDELSQKAGSCIPPGHIWIEGDGTGVDSRVFGCVPTGLLKGNIVARLSPVFHWFSKERDVKKEKLVDRDSKEVDADIRGHWAWRIRNRSEE
jgi:signal peptidase I